MFCDFFSEEKPKPPSEQPAAPISKEIITVPEEDTPWRRSGSLRNRAQQESPPKNRKTLISFVV